MRVWNILITIHTSCYHKFLWMNKMVLVYFLLRYWIIALPVLRLMLQQNACYIKSDTTIDHIFCIIVKWDIDCYSCSMRSLKDESHCLLTIEVNKIYCVQNTHSSSCFFANKHWLVSMPTLAIVAMFRWKRKSSRVLNKHHQFWPFNKNVVRSVVK
jgi:hypothetical protein